MQKAQLLGIFRDLLKDIKDETSGNFENSLVSLLTDRYDLDAQLVEKAVKGLTHIHNSLLCFFQKLLILSSIFPTCGTCWTKKIVCYLHVCRLGTDEDLLSEVRNKTSFVCFPI